MHNYSRRQTVISPLFPFCGRLALAEDSKVDSVHGSGLDKLFGLSVVRIDAYDGLISQTDIVLQEKYFLSVTNSDSVLFFLPKLQLTRSSSTETIILKCLTVKQKKLIYISTIIPLSLTFTRQCQKANNPFRVVLSFQEPLSNHGHQLP